MPNYVQDPNNPNKQVPGEHPKNYYGRVVVAEEFTGSKAPNSILINAAPSDGHLGLYLGSFNDFSASAVAETVPPYTASNQFGAPLPGLTGSQHYTRIGAPTAGTILDLHPVAYSGSGWSVSFIYNGGLDGSGRR